MRTISIGGFRRRGRIAALLVSVMVTATFGFALTHPSESAGATPGRALLARMQAAAASGDAEAARLLRAVTTFLASRNLGEAALDRAQPQAGRQVDVGGTDVFVEGFPPFYVQVTVPGKFATQEAFDRYLTARKRALTGLLRTSETIDANLTFTDFIPLDELLTLRRSIGFEIQGLTLDVWRDGKWNSRYAHGPNTPDFWRGSDSQILERVAAENAGFHRGEEPGEFRFTVHVAQVVASGRSAADLAARPEVLLLDPTNDVKAAFRNTAAEVFILSMPNMYHQMWVLRARAGTHAYPFYPDAAVPQKKGA
jgi:hypothetical protein